MRPPKGGKTPTVAETLALAEAWNERAALLSTLAFELSDLFGATRSPSPPVYLVRRLAGGASAANPQLVEDLRAEIFAAAERARQEARALLASAAKPSADAKAQSLGGTGRVEPRVDYETIKIPDAGDDIAPNPERSPATVKTSAPPDSTMAAPVDEEADAPARADPAALRKARRSKR